MGKDIQHRIDGFGKLIAGIYTKKRIFALFKEQY